MGAGGGVLTNSLVRMVLDVWKVYVVGTAWKGCVDVDVTRRKLPC